MEYRTNCKNCGAPLHYEKSDYGKTTTCKYCRTEYHIDLLGRVEEYKVKLEVFGKVRTYYIANVIAEPLMSESRSIDGQLQVETRYFTKLELIEC